MPTWCHMFNSTLIGSARVWFDKLPPESIDSYEIMWKAFLGNFSQQKKYIKDPVKIHHIKQREGESTEAFMERFKAKSMHVNGAPKCMRIFGFMHGIINPDLIKRLNDNIPKSVDEMMSTPPRSQKPNDLDHNPTSFAHLTKHVLVEVLKEKSTEEKEILVVVKEEEDSWMTPLLEYLRDGTLPAKVKRVSPLQAEYVLREIHEGSCSMHSGPRSIVAKAIKSGYYWPTMHKDTRNIIQKYDDCQVHRPVPKNPQQKLTPITLLWPFYKWGINIYSPFPKAQGKVKFMIIAIDYFTKWIEAKAIAIITKSQVKKFV
ncbi:reverse transcriptase domain-containing protein [Tanacetum coccineum]